jgi:EAL domain-containing protein (putative c-di-GMP-specific phosphodiesterase class I)
MGVGLSIDDFGTGYSSLAYLNRLPVNEVKIDKSFVLGLGDGQESATIARSIIDLGHNLGLVVGAEGVEDEATYRLLAGMACDLAQGYYLSRPFPAQDLAAWVKALPGLIAQASVA